MDARIFQYRNEVPISDATESVYVADESGDYTVQVAAGACVSDFSAAVTLHIITPETVTGLDEFTGRSMELYPNPATDEIFIRTNGPGRITLVDLTERVVESREADQEVRFETRWLSRGIYFARIEANGTGIIRRFIKQ